ncbi:thermonuclease family protein [Tropicibacter sp. Alg240-R139]|uniref:thermonuclease family protein n=1 Tax=Tropicibacter sp. Alg240-R139 TaxID=2305991 RepID=UPI001F087A9B|nr:thermonuclease family protein [Tropicibacter sp. Alg240-R139]
MVFGLVVLIGVLFLIFRSGNDVSDDVIDPFDTSPHKVKTNKSRSSTNRAPREMSPFDSSNAKHLREPRILTGAAWITDGDTVTIKKTQIRLFGIDAPELNHPFGVKAKWALHKLCKGQEIRAEIVDVDEYERTVAKCYLPDGRDLSAEMVKQGLAIDWPKYSGKKYAHLEVPDIRKKLFLADARQKGHMHVWKQFEARQDKRS